MAGTAQSPPTTTATRIFACPIGKNGRASSTKRDVELLGDDCLLWASDFPHEATRTDMRKLLKEFFDRKDLARAAKKKILYDNPKRFYAL